MSITLWNQHLNTIIVQSTKKNSFKIVKSKEKNKVYINWKFFSFLRKYLLKLFGRYCHLFVLSNDWVYTSVFLKEKELINKLYMSIYGKWHKKQSSKVYA